MDFGSDNRSGVAPEIMAALQAAATGTAASYGADAWTARVEKKFCETFEKDVAVFLTGTGTAANALALASFAPPHSAVICHEESHIHVDECGAPEFFTHGAKLAALPGANGKLEAERIEEAVRFWKAGGVHRPYPSLLSLTQLSEAGTVYRPAELEALTVMAKEAGMAVHMDGARFANALAALGQSPAEATWKAGVDVLSFGATKNGAMGAEAVIFFDPEKAGDFARRRKRAGQLFSKSRFLAAQMEAYLEDGLWLRLAAHANAMAARLAEGLTAKGARLLYPVEGNEVFAFLGKDQRQALKEGGAVFSDWELPDGACAARFVASFATAEADVDAALSLL